MRSGDVTCSSMKEFASDMLTPQDVVVDSHTAPSHIVIHLKCSKNDPFEVGAWLHLGATDQLLCPSTSGLLSSSATIQVLCFCSGMVQPYRNRGDSVDSAGRIPIDT